MVAQLPTELLELIFQGQPAETLRNLRLVNRQWSVVSTPFVFERFHASLFSGSLAKLLSVVSSPLAEHVKAIDFHTDRLPNWSRSKWEAKVDYRPSFTAFCDSIRLPGAELDRVKASQQYENLPKHSLTPEQIEAAYSVYREYLNEQKEWNFSPYVCSTIITSLKKLHNLNEVVADEAKPFDLSRTANTAYWKNFKRDILIGPDAWSYEVILHDDSVPTVFLLEAIGLRAAVAGVKPVERLVIEMPMDHTFLGTIQSSNLFRCFGVQKHSTDPTDTARYQSVVDAFRALKFLDLRCPGAEETSGLSGPMTNEPHEDQLQETEMLLNTATNLRSLDLAFGEGMRDFDEVEIEEDGIYAIDELLVPLMSHGTTTYPHLEAFKIGGSFPPKLFVTFLENHKGTLKKLDIQDCFSHDWDTVLTFIGKELDLEEVYIESLWAEGDERDEEYEFGDGPFTSLAFGEGLTEDNDYARDMKAFLLTGKGELPQKDDYDLSSEGGSLEHDYYDLFQYGASAAGAEDMGWLEDEMDATYGELESDNGYDEE